jgi:hypothetical protein
MKERVYLETSFFGYLTSRPQRDVLVAARQLLTQDWWNQRGIVTSCLSRR